MQKYLLVAFGGALGSLARFWAGGLITERVHGRFWYGTFFINITACLLIGFVYELLARHTQINPAWRYLIPIGFLGGYSTYSSFEWELFSSLRIGAFSLAALYVVLSLFVGLFAVYIGVSLARTIG